MSLYSKGLDKLVSGACKVLIDFGPDLGSKCHRKHENSVLPTLPD